MLRINSKEVKENDTFLALKGVKKDGHDYIEEAIKNGASKIICEHGKYSVETIIVPSTREYLSNYLKDKIDLSKVIMIGITGTNGKTTSAYLTYQLLNLLGIKSSYIGTIGFYIDKKVRDLNNTTPDLYDLYMIIDECIKNDVKVIVMEVSSHALALDRVYGIYYDIGVFTNLTQDHLDYHNTMDEYKKEKVKLFTKLRNNKYAIINSDSDYANDFIIPENNNITYGVCGTYKIDNINLSFLGSTFTINGKNISLNIPGKYNIYNYAISYIISSLLGFSYEDIISKTKYLTSPPGRFDIIKHNSNVIIVDYAHTPDAVANILKSVLEFKRNNIITIIGCGGDRDKGKRKIIGDICTDLSDYTIFTNDNPRSEDEASIISDITSNLNKNNYEIIYNRKDAIIKGIDILKEDDILLILGKKHENYQIIKDKKIQFYDKEIVLSYCTMI